MFGTALWAIIPGQTCNFFTWTRAKSPPDLHRPCNSTKLNYMDCAEPLSTTPIACRNNRSTTSVAVNSIDQRERIAQLHGTQTSVAEIPNEQDHERHALDNLPVFDVELFCLFCLLRFVLSRCCAMARNMQTTSEATCIINMDLYM